jgi:ribosomal protein S12 methylthiotransferase
LKLMKRPASAEKVLERIRAWRAICPGITIRSTFIVGFPGETEADVEALTDFVSTQAFDHVGVFTYSHEEGTSAYSLENDVPERSKQARRRRVMSLQKRGVQQRLRRRVGEGARVLIDGPSGEHELVVKARLATQAPDIDAAVYLTECDPSRYRPGDFADVTIVGTRDYDLIGRPVL